MQGQRRAVVAAGAGAVLLLLFVSQRSCTGAPTLCGNGRWAKPQGLFCVRKCEETKSLHAEVLWNAPLHSWTGVAAEAVDFLIPLSRFLPNLGLTGGFVEEYVAELPEIEQLQLSDMKLVAEAISIRHLNGIRDYASIYVTQYAPGTYKSDFDRHQGSTFDYRVGRPMFETSRLPEGWKESCNLMDEIWVPSKWGKEVFIRGGVRASHIHVIPEAIDIKRFDPKRVRKDFKLIPGAKDSFVFLSIFKWEDRKGWDALIRAFVLEFKPEEKVMLYLRSGEEETVKWDVDNILRDLELQFEPQITFLPRVTHEEYLKLYATAHAFVLPTHGEGWGRPLMEAMAMGLPTISTDWSGQTEFMDDENSFLIPVSRMEPAFPNQPELTGFAEPGTHEWAAIDIAKLRKLMRHVYEHQDIAKATGAKARQSIVNRFSRSRVESLVADRLRLIMRKIYLRHTR